MRQEAVSRIIRGVRDVHYARTSNDIGITGVRSLVDRSCSLSLRTVKGLSARAPVVPVVGYNKKIVGKVQHHVAEMFRLRQHICDAI
jgi:hypothetical protein